MGFAEAVACDNSKAMLEARPASSVRRVCADAASLPFAPASFDAVFCVNLLEHVADVDQVLAEGARVLAPSGTWAAITPNGNWELLLDAAEKLGLKLPEGPHQFLTPEAFVGHHSRHFVVREHGTFLCFPFGSARVSKLLDTLSLLPRWSGGFFQYVIASRRP
jgi:SAM-dependent methyltransferase